MVDQKTMNQEGRIGGLYVHETERTRERNVSIVMRIVEAAMDCLDE